MWLPEMMASRRKRRQMPSDKEFYKQLNCKTKRTRIEVEGQSDFAIDPNEPNAVSILYDAAVETGALDPNTIPTPGKDTNVVKAILFHNNCLE